ncbi:hypothetical protein [Hymenobacter sublimis]|uniref:Lipoprotein n=1 Tax=Hymenobacter sublimis TaxID=2933777 RepID=A0ABY4JBE4_9BACT|nr:hypothetical protein [Hymenobacter sublimis]UPL50137.1 hypothetical protein MWH26_04315 [Hymenobacter sublimis]
MKQPFTLGFGALALLSGCITPVDEAESGPKTELLVKSLESEYGCYNTARQMHINLSETYTVIHSQAQFDQLVSGSCRPQIDFATYDLVIGKKGLPNSEAGIHYTLQREYETKRVVLHVVFTLSMTTEAPNVTYHALVPKLAASEGVDVKIEMKK